MSEPLQTSRPNESSSQYSAGLSHLLSRIREWLYFEDDAPILAALASYVANRIEGEPVWLLLVGPPGSGKTEIVGLLCDAPRVVQVSTLTEAGFLSGSGKDEQAKDATGGLLREIGRFGIIVIKEFTTLLSIRHEKRAEVFAALREVYDGRYTRVVGMDGGKRLSWTGKAGFIGASTPTIDRHHAALGAMGERFCFVRLGSTESRQLLRIVLGHDVAMAAAKGSTPGAVRAFLEDRTAAMADSLPRLCTTRLAALAEFAVVARSAVERDGYNREIIAPPVRESPARLAKVLDQLGAALLLIGVPEWRAWEVVARVALDSLASMRAAALIAAVKSGEVTAGALATTLSVSLSTARRTLEDLAALGVLVLDGATGDATVWRESDETRELRVEAFPEGFPEISTPTQRRLSRNVCPRAG